MGSSDYGLLINPPISLQRKNFQECCKLLGVNVMYSFPLSADKYSLQGEIETSYSYPEKVSCIFSNTLDQKTSKLLGWDAELQEEASVIHLPYDLHDLQIGCIVEVPSAFDNTPSRKFRIVEMSAIPIYPASIACKIIPEYTTVVEKSDIEQFNNTNFNLLYEESGRHERWK